MHSHRIDITSNGLQEIPLAFYNLNWIMILFVLSDMACWGLENFYTEF